jgi:hypothetical protein
MRHVAAAALLLTVAASPAFADATVFIGSTTTPSSRAAKGVALGVSVLIVGFEFEYSDTSENTDEEAPSLRTGMGNVLLQTPFPVAGMQFYGTVGAGAYRERLGVDLPTPTHEETHVGINTLRGEPLHSTVHRVYAGLNLAF